MAFDTHGSKPLSTPQVEILWLRIEGRRKGFSIGSGRERGISLCLLGFGERFFGFCWRPSVTVNRSVAEPTQIPF